MFKNIMFSDFKNCSVVIVLIIVSIISAPEISGAEITKRVTFPKGKTAVIYKGKLTREYDSYVLRAKKGRTMTVKLTTTDADASFAIYETEEFGPDEDTILTGNPTLRLFTGKLPITSEYSVQVYGVSSDDNQNPTGAAYTIEISLR